MMKKCKICKADCVNEVCVPCQEFLAHVAPLSFECHIAHYSRKQAGDMARLIEYLTDNNYEKNDESYFNYDSYFFHNTEESK